MHEKILVVDDEPDVLAGIVETLTNKGYNVTAASSGKEGLSYIKNEEFDLLLTDIKMPEMGGDELLLETKKIRPDLMSIVLSAHGTMDLAIKCLKESVAFDFLDKTCDEHELLLPIEKALKIKKNNSEKDLQLKNSLSNAIVLTRIRRFKKDMRYNSAYTAGIIGTLGFISLLLYYFGYDTNLIHPSLSLVFAAIGVVSLITFFSKGLWNK